MYRFYWVVDRVGLANSGIEKFPDRPLALGLPQAHATVDALDARQPELTHLEWPSNGIESPGVPFLQTELLGKGSSLP